MVEEKSDTMAQSHEGTQSRFMTVGEVASVLRVSSMTVYRLINAGELPAVRIGRSLRVRSEDLDRYLADRFTKAG
ncbi:MAG: helix-turn-helix domain-containing protein [Actinomycetota bacterium]|jgi:excisionase family DNA binding protein|nr:helix-turn-helix domain-containing protein [Actinomycetota bacterium]